MIKNALTFDLEDWFHPLFVSRFISKSNEKSNQIEDSVNAILKMLDKYSVNATFFVLGEVAEVFPELIKKIYDSGHEIGSHGYHHKSLNSYNIDSFTHDIQRSTNLLRKITRASPSGFRAPNFSLDQDTKWALNVLECEGYEYDSSIFPFRVLNRSLYGINNAPMYPYYPSKEDITQESTEEGIVEFPLSVASINGRIRIPIAGGAYLRLFPSKFMKFMIEKINSEKRPAIIYLHPWETYSKTPRIEMPFPYYQITYYGISSTLSKLDFLLKNFRFDSAYNIIHESI